MNKTYQKRPYHIDKIAPFIGVDLIKVLIDQRRVGKSYILLQLIDVLKSVKSIEKKACLLLLTEISKFAIINLAKIPAPVFG